MDSSSSSNKSKDFFIARLFVTTIRQFFGNTSLDGFKYLVKEGISTFEKLLWYVIQLCGIAGACYIFLYALDGFVSKPTFTSLTTVNHPIWNIPFPAVAVCSVNKISRKAAMEYAVELSKRTKNQTFDWLFKKVRHLGDVLDFDTDQYDKSIIFQDLLDIIDVNNETHLFDTQDKFEFKISPKCEDLMVRCQWGNSVIECMSLFSYRKTRDGYCCLFNYVRQFNVLSTEDVQKPTKTGFTGPDTGLTFILNTTTSDYYYSMGDFIGFNVQIFNPSDFADVQNGGLSSLFVDTNTKAYFKVIPTTIQSKEAIEQYSPVQRGCLFEHELFKQYAGHYSFVDCLLKCKLRNIITLCGCMPFFLPTNFPDGTVTPVKCTLAHNKCLQRYKNMVNSYTIPNIEHPLDDTVECLECLPICSKTNFRVLPSYFELNKKGLEKSNASLLQNLSTFDDIAIVHIYFPLVDSTLFTADVVMTWQEIVSNFGGLLGLCLGFSLVNIVEIVYFATVRLYQNISLVKNTKQDDSTHHKIHLTHEDIRIRDIYVNDFNKFNRKMFHNRT